MICFLQLCSSKLQFRTRVKIVLDSFPYKPPEASITSLVKQVLAPPLHRLDRLCHVHHFCLLIHSHLLFMDIAFLLTYQSKKGIQTYGYVHCTIYVHYTDRIVENRQKLVSLHIWLHRSFLFLEKTNFVFIKNFKTDCTSKLIEKWWCFCSFTSYITVILIKKAIYNKKYQIYKLYWPKVDDTKKKNICITNETIAWNHF